MPSPNISFYGLLEIIDDRANFLGANRLEARLQFTVGLPNRNLSKLKIATFYPTDVKLWFNQIETQFDLHNTTDDDIRFRLTHASLSGEVASDVRDVLLQPFLVHK